MRCRDTDAFGRVTTECEFQSQALLDRWLSKQGKDVFEFLSDGERQHQELIGERAAVWCVGWGGEFVELGHEFCEVLFVWTFEREDQLHGFVCGGCFDEQDRCRGRAFFGGCRCVQAGLPLCEFAFVVVW